MVRYIFPPDVFLYAGDTVTVGLGSVPDALLAASAPFTMWSTQTGGTNYTSDLKALDGVSSITAVADSSGVRPSLRGPDNVTVMWCDTGSGVRYPVIATDLTKLILDAFVANGLVLGGGSGGGLPVGTTLDQIADGTNRLALTTIERSKIAATPSTFLQIGTTSTTAKAGNYTPAVADVTGLSTELSVRELIIRWDAVVRAWPPRQVSYGFGALFLSTNDPTAPPPPSAGLLVGDVWRRHPNAS